MRADLPDVSAPEEQAGLPLFRVDAGWLFLGAGAALIAATTLLPALDDLREASYRRDEAIAIERFHKDRLANYTAYLDALEQGDPTLVRSLASSQLNLMPAHMKPLTVGGDPNASAAALLAELEPRLVPPPRPVPFDSLLHRLATGEHTRLWVLATGAVCILFGLLPPAERVSAEGPAKPEGKDRAAEVPPGEIGAWAA